MPALDLGHPADAVRSASTSVQSAWSGAQSHCSALGTADTWLQHKLGFREICQPGWQLMDQVSVLPSTDT